MSATSSVMSMVGTQSIAHVLVCLDLTTQSHSCLPYAKYIAEAFHARVTLLHVLPSPNEPDALEWEVSRREAARYLAEAKTFLGTSASAVDIRLEQGAAAREIIAASGDDGVDLTILSSHGPSGGTTVDLGSNAQHVLAQSSGSILFTQPGGTASVPPRRLLVPLDGSVRSESVLPTVVGLARLHAAAVLLVHVVKEPSPTGFLAEEDDLKLARTLASRIEGHAEAYLRRIRAQLLSDVATVETLVVRRDDERKALLDIAAKETSDLIVLTAHGTTCDSEIPFGSVAAYLLTHSTLPLLVFQDLSRHAARALRGSGMRMSPRIAEAE